MLNRNTFNFRRPCRIESMQPLLYLTAISILRIQATLTLALAIKPRTYTTTGSLSNRRYTVHRYGTARGRDIVFEEYRFHLRLHRFLPGKSLPALHRRRHRLPRLLPLPWPDTPRGCLLSWQGQDRTPPHTTSGDNVCIIVNNPKKLFPLSSPLVPSMRLYGRNYRIWSGPGLDGQDLHTL